MPRSPEPDPVVPEDGRSQARWLMRLRRAAGRGYLLALGAPLVSGGLLVAQAFVLARLLHGAIVDGAPPMALAGGIATVGGLMLARSLVGLLGERQAIAAAERVKLGLRQALFDRVLKRPPSWSDGRSSGALSGVLVEQVEAIEGFISRFYPSMIQASVLPVAFAAIILPLDWLAALLFLVTAPLIPVFMALAGWGAEAASRRQATALSRLSARFADRLRGLVTLRLFGQAASETEAMHAASEELRRRTMVVLRIAFLSSAVLEFFAALGVAGVALYVGLSFLGLVNLRGTPLPYEVGLFVLLMAPEIYQPLRLLAANYHDRAAAMAAVAEIALQMDGLPETATLPDEAAAGSHPAREPLPGMASLQKLPTGMAVAGLIVRTPGSGRVVLDRLDLDIDPGRHVAILGESGIGKSSLLEAMARLRPHEGSISLGGMALDRFEERALRETLAFLPQRPHLFHASLADNIRLGRPTDPEVLESAARRAGLGELLAHLPAGLATVTGDGGLGLSGGEAQRIALARILIRDPSIILLDEPTAHLDATTEAMVLDHLAGFARHRTLVIATHSPDVAARMDDVWRLAGGRLEPVRLGRRKRYGRPGLKETA